MICTHFSPGVTYCLSGEENYADANYAEISDDTNEFSNSDEAIAPETIDDANASPWLTTLAASAIVLRQALFSGGKGE
jgi:hypothetical protein